MLIPRLTTTNRDLISSPAAGLIIYNTDCNNINLYNGTAWVDMVGDAVTGNLPDAPTAATHTPSETQIVWNWNTVSGATGYKWGTTTTYSSATDVSTSTTYTQTSLTCTTPYTLYVWAYNNCGGSASPTILTQTSSSCFTCGSTITDSRDSKTYTTVQIGSQCWMAKNLNVGTYVTGTTTQAGGADNYNASIEKYCYGDNEANCATYGGLYQWAESMAYKDNCSNTTSLQPSMPVQGICPISWHIPSEAEWVTLEEYLGMCSGTGTGCSGATGWRGTDEGNKLKTTGNGSAPLWLSPSAGTNSSGYSAIPGGRHPPGSFGTIGDDTGWWTATEADASNTWRHYLWSGSPKVNRENNGKDWGFSVRCLKD